jgi:hypothetical protein
VVLFLTNEDIALKQSIQEQILATIRARGRGWAFSSKDLLRGQSRSAVDLALHRLTKEGRIRRVIRGIYDYPEESDSLKQKLSPDLDQVAQALARKFGWRTQPSGPTALNLIGLSTQVPARMVYLSDGPSRTYRIGNRTVAFRKTVLKEAHFRLRESALIVQAFKSLGSKRITPEAVDKVRRWLDPAFRKKVLEDTHRVTGWIYDAIRKTCKDDE